MAFSAAERALLVKTNKEELLRTLDKMRKNLYGETIQQFNRWGNITIGELKGSRLSGRLPDDTGLYIRSGDLIKGFRWRVTGTNLSNAVGRFTSRIKYAAIHEYGGDIHQVRGGNPVTIHIPARMGFRDLLFGQGGTGGALGRFVAQLKAIYQRIFDTTRTSGGKLT